MEKESADKLKSNSKARAQDELTSYFKRCGKTTPPFFKKLRLAGLLVATVGTTMLTAPITLPTTALTIAGYLATAGAVATAVSQAAMVDGANLKNQEDSEK